MSRSIVTAAVLGLLAVGACKKKESDPAPKVQATEPEAPKPEPAKEPAPAADSTAAIGVEAGGIQRDEQEGPAGILANVNGTVEVKRVGETQWTAAAKDAKLYPGDTVRTGESSSATVAFADESTAEVAEVSTLAVASRDGTADPGSSAAVLGGLTRFTVTPRAPGEGAFRVYTSSGVVITKGTTYGVGVAASGEARIGVESGAVDVIGIAALDAQPVVVEKSSQVVIAADGKVGSAAAWTTDDWGTWRDDTDAKVQVVASVDAHGQALADLNQALIDGYAELQSTADSAATFEATAAATAEKNDTAAYQAAQVDGAVAIDASFALAGRLEALTWAHAAHASLATDLYVRHPADVEASWKIIAPRVDASVLWPKRFEVTAGAFFQPLRAQYYVHHPRGRAHAALVGIAVPAFYASVEPQPVEPAKVRAKLKGQIWVAPELTYKASARPVWAAAPAASWHAKVKVAPAPARAKVAWYVRPPTLKSTAYLGAKVSGKWDSKLDVKPAAPWATLRAAWTIPVGTKIVVPAPDLSAAATARAKVKIGADGRLVRDHRAGAGMAAGAGANIKGKVVVPEVKAPDVDVKGKVGIGVKAGADIKAGAGAAVGGAATTIRDHRDGAVKASADIKGGAGAAAGAAGGVKAGASGAAGGAAGAAGSIKVKPPEVKLKGEAKGSFKIGN